MWDCVGNFSRLQDHLIWIQAVERAKETSFLVLRPPESLLDGIGGVSSVYWLLHSKSGVAADAQICIAPSKVMSARQDLVYYYFKRYERWIIVCLRLLEKHLRENRRYQDC